VLVIMFLVRTGVALIFTALPGRRGREAPGGGPLAEPGAFPDLAEQIHLLGATGIPLLRAGHHLVSEEYGVTGRMNG